MRLIDAEPLIDECKECMLLECNDVSWSDAGGDKDAFQRLADAYSMCMQKMEVVEK